MSIDRVFPHPPPHTYRGVQEDEERPYSHIGYGPIEASQIRLLISSPTIDFAHSMPEGIF